MEDHKVLGELDVFGLGKTGSYLHYLKGSYRRK